MCTRSAGLGSAPRQRGDASRQLEHAKRLGHVIVGAALESEHLVRLVSLRRQQQNRHVLIDAALANRSADGHPVDVGQHQIEHDHIKRLLERQRQPLAAVADGFALVAGAPKLLGDELADTALVFDEQNSAAGCRQNRERHPI